MKKLAGLLALLLLAAPLGAQTVNKTALWSQPEAPSVVAGFVYTLKIDTANPVTITPTCVAQPSPGTGTNCSSPVTISNGPHTVVLTATNAFGSASSSISGQPPTNPTGFTITIVIVQSPTTP